jgi:hypothetical protein
MTENTSEKIKPNSDRASLSYCSPKLERRVFPKKGGQGIFAKELVKSGELICVWGGQILTGEQVLEIPIEHRHMIIQVEDNLFQYSYLASDAEYINHSCEPNAGVYGQIALVALRDIAPDEEVCFDYAMTENNHFKHEQFDCYCGSPSCRQRITGQDWKNPQLWKKYKGYFSLHIQRKIDSLNY